VALSSVFSEDTACLVMAAAQMQAAGLLGAVAAYYALRPAKPPQRERRLTDVYKEDLAGEGKEYVPPLPPNVKELLVAANLAHLSISDGVNPPHTCLMNMTFVAAEEDVIVMTTRRDTKKFVLMENCDSVSLLIHDFPQMKETEEFDRSFKRTLSISVMGLVRIEGGARAEKYRGIHLGKNAQYRQFIEGEDKAVITVKIVRCRMCDVQDQVTTWERGL
jgi:hypothetical protein